MLTCLFWYFCLSRDLPGWMYVRQRALLYGLLALLTLLTVVWLPAVKRPGMLLPALARDGLCLAYPGLVDYWVSYSRISGFFCSGNRLNQESYVPFGQPNEGLLVLGLVITTAYLACCFVRLTPKKSAPEETT